jgi:hypothetical protein
MLKVLMLQHIIILKRSPITLRNPYKSIKFAKNIINYRKKLKLLKSL